MIYEGALIQRLVTPHWPGDPALAAAGAPDIRTEWVLRDQPGEPVTWTLAREEGQHYPTHLKASLRAKELGAHCHASVVGGDRSQDFQHRMEKVRAGRAKEGSRLPHNQKTVGSTPTPATNLPAESSSSDRAPKQLRSRPVVRVVEQDPRAAGKSISKRTRRGRLAALRASQDRITARESVPNDRAWYREGQYA